MTIVDTGINTAHVWPFYLGQRFDTNFDISDIPQLDFGGRAVLGAVFGSPQVLIFPASVSI